MSDTAIAPAPTATTSDNIAKGVADKAAGKAVQNAAKAPEPVKTGAKTAEGDPNAGKRKYIVNGQERWLTPQQADDYVQKGLSFEPRISELARLQAETARFLEVLKTDPAKVLYNPKVGLTPKDALAKILQSTKVSDEIKDAVGQWYYENVVKREQMDEKDRAILERDEQIKDLTAGEKAREEARIAQENMQKVNVAMAQLKGQIKEALTEIGITDIDSPLGAQLAKRIADVMRLSYFARKPCTVKEAVAKVREEIKAFQKQWYDGLDEDKLVEELGKENAEKIRKHFLKVVKAAEKESAQESGQKQTAPRRDERKTMTPDEFREYLDGLKRSGK
jgi:hypothetical protein